MSASPKIEGLLEPDTLQRQAIDATLDRFAEAHAFVVEVGRREATTGNARLHHLCYRTLRRRYGLHANLAIRAIARAARDLKEVRTSEAEDKSMELDARVFSYFRNEGTVSMATVLGRIRGIRLVLPLDQQEHLKTRVPRRVLLWKAVDGTYRIEIQLSVEVLVP